jgi:hypothetical protein
MQGGFGLILIAARPAAGLGIKTSDVTVRGYLDKSPDIPEGLGLTARGSRDRAPWRDLTSPRLIEVGAQDLARQGKGRAWRQETELLVHEGKVARATLLPDAGLMDGAAHDVRRLGSRGFLQTLMGRMSERDKTM